MTAAGANIIRTPQEWARILGGKVMENGRTVRFPRPDGNGRDRSCRAVEVTGRFHRR
jgi:hypothetical protein